MSSLRKALLAGAGGTIISMGLTGAALASAVTLNPGANNAPAGAALCATCADFTATAATIEQHSLIVFSGTGAGTTFSETGNFIISSSRIEYLPRAISGGILLFSDPKGSL